MKRRNYTHVQALLPEIKAMPAEGKIQREAAERDGFKDKYVVKTLLKREHRKGCKPESVPGPHTQTQEQIDIRKEQLMELDAALDKPTAREPPHFLYRYGFADGIRHLLTGTALHFHLGESRTKKAEGETMDGAREAAVVVLKRW